MSGAAAALTILTYHRIGLPPSQSTCRGLFTALPSLAIHLRLLSRFGYGFVSFDDLAAWYDTGAALPRKPVLVSFDDGHRDNLAAAALLKRSGATATMFALAGELGSRCVAWAEASERATTDLISWDQARQLHGDGWRIESHGLTHRHLDRLEPRELAAELVNARARISAEIGRPPLALAYPYGVANPAVRAAARQAGYRFACSTERGVNHLPALDPWSLRRIAVKGYRRIHLLRFAVAALRGFA